LQRTVATRKYPPSNSTGWSYKKLYAYLHLADTQPFSQHTSIMSRKVFWRLCFK